MAQDQKTTRSSLRPRLTLPHEGLNNGWLDPASTTEALLSDAAHSLAATSSDGSSNFSSTTTASGSLDSATTSKLLTRVKRRLLASVTRRRQRSADAGAEAHPEISWPTTTTTTHHSKSSSAPHPNEHPTVGLDALALSRAELTSPACKTPSIQRHHLKKQAKTAKNRTAVDSTSSSKRTSDVRRNIFVPRSTQVSISISEAVAATTKSKSKPHPNPSPDLATAPPSLLPPTLALRDQIPIDPALSFGGLRVAEGRVAERCRRLGS
jgi:hypothetical protein